jgi:sulfonate transport system substrate-binding protein
VPEWTNLSGGPEVINGFRSGSVDLASNAGIPPIQAQNIGGIDAKIVAVRLTRVPTYVFVTRPGNSGIETVADFRRKKLGFSEGQAQGIVLLRALKQEGIDFDNVDLVPLTAPQFLTALQAGQIDVAPLGITSVYQYLNQYGPDGAKQIETNVIDRLSILWAPGRVLKNEAKVAAIAAFIPIWAKGSVWQHENPDTWIQKYFVEDQNISAEQGRAVVEASSKPLYPPTWDEAIQWEQETIDLMAETGYSEKFDANEVFDRRFERLGADAVAEEYRS